MVPITSKPGISSTSSRCNAASPGYTEPLSGATASPCLLCQGQLAASHACIRNLRPESSPLKCSDFLYCFLPGERRTTDPLRTPLRVPHYNHRPLERKTEADTSAGCPTRLRSVRTPTFFPSRESKPRADQSLRPECSTDPRPRGV